MKPLGNYHEAEVPFGARIRHCYLGYEYTARGFALGVLIVQNAEGDFEDIFQECFNNYVLVDD